MLLSANLILLLFNLILLSLDAVYSHSFRWTLLLFRFYTVSFSLPLPGELCICRIFRIYQIPHFKLPFSWRLVHIHIRYRRVLVTFCMCMLTETALKGHVKNCSNDVRSFFMIRSCCLAMYIVRPWNRSFEWTFMVKTVKPSRPVTRADFVWWFSSCSELINSLYFKILFFLNKFHLFAVKSNLRLFASTGAGEKSRRRWLVLAQLCVVSSVQGEMLGSWRLGEGLREGVRAKEIGMILKTFRSDSQDSGLAFRGAPRGRWRWRCSRCCLPAGTFGVPLDA